MSKAVVYFNSGTKCLVRMAVSIASLRDHYSGDVVVYNEGEPHPLLMDVCESYSVKIVTFPERGQEKTLVTKVAILEYLQHDTVVFLDADTLVMQDISQLFEWTETHGLVFTNFEDWFTRGKTIQGRIEGWRGIVSPPYIEQALNYGTAINTGVFGIQKGHEIIKVWTELAPLGAAKNLFIPDEISAQILAPSFKHYLAPKEYNRSARYGSLDGCVVAHFHGRKHTGKWALSKKWRSYYWEKQELLYLSDPLGDKALSDHMRKVRLPVSPYISKGGQPEVEQVQEEPAIPIYPPPSRRNPPKSEGVWLDVVTTIVPRATVGEAMRNFLSKFDKQGCKLRWVAHLDYVPAMESQIEETLSQIKEVTPLFDDAVFHQRTENVGHGLSLKWCFEQTKHDAIIWEDDKVAGKGFKFADLRCIAEAQKADHISFLDRGVRAGSTSPSWWSTKLIKFQLDNWPISRGVEEGDSELALIRNSRGFRGRLHIPLRVQDIGIKAQGDLGVVRQKDKSGGKYYYTEVDERVTFVTAVDRKYMKKFKMNAANWKQRMNIMSYPLIVFRDDSVTDEQIRTILPAKDLQIFEWEFPPAGDNQREKMLSGFVFLAAEKVKTPYWVKLDADVHLLQRNNDRYCKVFFDEWFDYDLVGHKWGYTKVKGDPGQTQHWLNVLDDWWLDKFPGATRLFPEGLPPNERYGHKRIASYYCLQSTELTKVVSKLCGDRLPVPSHDTVMWYVATQLEKPVLRYQMKRLGFSPR